MKIYIVLAMFLAFGAIANDSVAKVVSLKGRVFVKKEKQSFKKLTADSLLQTGDLIKTFNKSRVKIIFNDKSVIYVAPKSQFIIKEYKYDKVKKERSSVLNLLGGRVKLFVAKLSSKNKTFKVNTETATVGVRGTKFIVSSENEGETEVLVLSGSVEVKNPLDETNKSVILSKGDIVKSIGALPILSPTKANKEELKRLSAKLNLSTMMNLNLKYKKLLKKIKYEKLLKKTKIDLENSDLKPDSKKKNKRKRIRKKGHKKNFFKNGYVAPNRVKVKVRLEGGSDE